jgi:hypothetical protein
MNSRTFVPTCYPEINAVLEDLLEGVQTRLNGCLTGLYLHGSLAYGDFNPHSSDIDFLVVTEEVLLDAAFSSLKEMHARLFASEAAWAQKLEGAYLPRGQLRRHDLSHALIPWLGEDGHFALERLGSDWILQRWILREKGIVVAGPSLTSLIDPVSPEALKEAVRSSLREWWSPPFSSPQRFEDAAYRVYAILTMCRSLYVLEHGRVASKPQAAEWAMVTLEEPWRTLVALAAAWNPGMDFDLQEATFGLIQFTRKKWGLPASRP